MDLYLLDGVFFLFVIIALQINVIALFSLFITKYYIRQLNTDLIK